MSQSAEPDNRLGFTLRTEPDLSLFRQARQRAAAERAAAPSELDNIDVARTALESYVSDSGVGHLLDDKRVDDVRELVASDLDMDPEEVSPKAALLHTCAAYAGYARVDDWREG